MYTLIAVIFLLAAFGAIGRAVFYPSQIAIFSACVSLFSIGYYVLPLLFHDLSPLAKVKDSDVDQVALMAFVYYICVVTSLEVMLRNSRIVPKLRLRRLDAAFARHWWITTVACSVLYIWYISTTTLTSYSSEDFNAFFEERSAFSSILSFTSSLMLAALAINLASAISQRRVYRSLCLGAVFLFIEIRLLGAGQRLIFITPLLTLFAAFVSQHRYKISGMVLVGGVLALLVVSPFAVALREARGQSSTSKVENVSVSYDEGYAATTLRSILDRADLLYVMTRVKDHVDENGFAGPTFYASVLAVPVPRAIYPSKPYVLSDTGTADGETSILAWRLIVGPTKGSLTAFGSIVAYRLGGWPAVVLDGIFTGALIGLLLTAFGSGGIIGAIFFSITFVNWSVRKVPPSFFEALADVLTYLPVVLALALLNWAWVGRRSSHQMSGRRK